MKNTDPSFPFVAAIVLAGVIVALTSPAPAPTRASTPVAQAASHAPVEAAVD